MGTDAADPLHVVCPHCHSTNRVMASDLAAGPGKTIDCGQCHLPLLAGAPVALDEAQFERHLRRSDLPVLVDFWAPWCGPCLQMAPQFVQAAKTLEPRFQLAKVDTEAQQRLGARFNIRSIPTLALFAGGREIARQAGAMGANDIVRWARSHAPG